jgi:hypothetical protein
MSQQKFASNVVEKCLTFGGPDERQLLVNEMLGSTDENEPLQVILAFTTLTPLPVVILETHAHTKIKRLQLFSDVFSKTNLIVSSPCHIPPLLYVFFFQLNILNIRYSAELSLIMEHLNDHPILTCSSLMNIKITAAYACLKASNFGFYLLSLIVAWMINVFGIQNCRL